MDNIVKLIVETDASGAVVGLRTVKDEAEKAGAVVKSSGEAGRLGFFALGQSVEDAAASMGVARQATRQLGNSVERMAASALPGFGTALGVATLAVTAAVAIYNKFIDDQEELRNAVIESGNALADEVIGLEKNRVATENARKAHYDLYLMKRRIAVKELELAIEAQTEKIKEQVETINDGGTTLSKFKRLFTTAFDWKGAAFENRTIVEAWAEQTVKDLEKPRNELEKSVLALAGMYVKMKDLGNTALPKSTFEEGSYDEEKSTGLTAKEIYEADMAEMARTRELDIENAQAYYDLRKETGVSSIEEQMDEEQRIFEMGLDDYLQSLRQAGFSEEQITKAKNARLLQQATDYYSREKKISQAALAYRSEIASDLSDILNDVYELGGERQEAFFYLSKAAAAAEAIINGYVAAGKAEATLGPAGTGYASYFIAAGYARAAIIAAQTLTGASGGSSDSSSSTSSSVSSGSTTNEYKYWEYESSKYGTGWRPGEGGGNTYIVAGDVYGTDKFEEKVNKAVQQNIKDSGETRDVIRRYANA